jgi:hypothetical protein
MKNLENYVCTLEQSKKLCELGVEQSEALYHWVEGNYLMRNEERNDMPPNWYPSKRIGAAFTNQELGELINDEISEYNYSIWQECTANPFCWMKEVDCNLLVFEKTSKSEAQARAEFLIYLLENKNVV